MASTFPTTLDTFTDPSPSSPRNNPSLAGVLVKVHDAIEAVQSTLGTTTAKAGFNSTQNQQTGTTYTLVLADVGKLVEMSNASPITLTIPLNSSVAFNVGDRIDLMRSGAGLVTVVGDAGVTVNSSVGLKLRAQYSIATLIKRATNTWVLAGDLSA